MNELSRNLVFAFRALRRQPGFTAVVLVTLALGIGVNLTVLQMAHAFVTRPLPFIDTGTVEDGLLVSLAMDHETQRVEAFDFSQEDVDDFTEQCTTCSAVAAYDGRAVVLTRPGARDAESTRRVLGQAVSPELFSILATPAARGRVLQAGDARHETSPVVVLSHSLWQRLGGETAWVGRELMLDGQSTTVVGIMPEGFQFPERAELWMPLVPRAETTRSQRYLDNVVARLRPGVELAQAQSEAGAIAARLAAAHPDSNGPWSIRVMPFRERLVNADVRRVLMMLIAAVGLVLSIACANVTNLLLARETTRRQAAAIRLALGADRLSLFRQHMTESLLLALGGGLLGLLLSGWTLDYLTHADPEGMPAWVHLTPGADTFGIMLGVTLIASVAFGVLPALRAARPALRTVAGSGVRGTTGRASQRLQRLLVVGQVAVALVLLGGAGATVESARSLMRIDAGFDTDPMLTMRLHLPEAAAASEARRAERIRRFDRVVERLGQLPGVEAAVATSALPLIEDGTATPFSYPGQSLRDGEREIVTYILQNRNLFDALGVPMLAGRSFTTRELLDPTSRSVIVSDTVAERLPGGLAAAVGSRVRLGDGDGPWSIVVGVVPSLYFEEPGEETDQSRMQVHLPYAHRPWRAMGVLLRTSVPPATLSAAVREAVAAADPSMAVESVRTMDVVRQQVVWAERLLSELFGSLALLAVVLAVVGLYGVMAFVVAQRIPEIGIRMALGADRGAIRALVLRNGLVMIGLGLALGLPMAWAAMKVLGQVFYGIEGLEPGLLALAVLGLGAAALLGVAVPSASATRVEPVDALRQG